MALKIVSVSEDILPVFLFFKILGELQDWALIDFRGGNSYDTCSSFRNRILKEEHD